MLHKVFGGDKIYKEPRQKIKRVKFDQFKMKEGESITQYSERIKQSVSAIRASRGKIDDDTIINKVLRSLLPIYAIRVSAIKEIRCNRVNNLTLDTLVGRLTNFELDNFDKCAPTSSNFESAFKVKLALRRKGGNSKRKQVDSEEENESDEDLEVLEDILAKREAKGKGKFRGKIPLICFSCEEVGHIAPRCPKKEDKYEERFKKFKDKKYFKSYKDYKHCKRF